MNTIKKLGSLLNPQAKKAEDGRDQWSSRTAFVLAAMGGAVGLGNLLRYPSQVYNNYGLQWFVPYLMALFLLGMPVLMLEISLGQAYRGGCVIAYNNMSRRFKGVGFSLVFNGFVVVVYYVPILGWVMDYFRNSFQSPLPWTGRGEEFYMGDVVANPDPVPGTFGTDGSVLSYTSYPGTGMVGETVGWIAFTWFIVWLCMFKGVAVTGRVVYITMGLPVITMIILLGRAVSLPNAVDGVRLYFATWRGETLANGQIWQSACGQIFFSIGLGMGYFTSYASYNRKFSNAVQDSIIIATCNSLYEVIGAFAVFGIVGFIQLFPEEGVQLGSFTVAFLTYPEALAQMPGANFFAVLFFLTLMFLGFSSAFALLDTSVTMICDSDWGRKFSRVTVSISAVLIAFLLSLIYATEFGFYLLDAVDTWINNMSLLFVVWSECVAATSLYRCKDIGGQLGWSAWAVYNVGYVGAMVFGVAVAHAVSAEAGAGMAFGLFVACATIAILVSRTPDSGAPSFWGRHPFLSRFWYLAFYSGNQLTRDLNISVSVGNNWPLPVFWAPLLRYVSAPILAIVFGFAYPAFYIRRNDPLQIFGFAVAHLVMLWIALGFVFPRMLDIFIPASRMNDGKIEYAPNVTTSGEELYLARSVEAGDAYDDPSCEPKSHTAGAPSSDSSYSDGDMRKGTQDGSRDLVA